MRISLPSEHDVMKDIGPLACSTQREKGSIKNFEEVSTFSHGRELPKYAVTAPQKEVLGIQREQEATASADRVKNPIRPSQAQHSTYMPPEAGQSDNGENEVLAQVNYGATLYTNLLDYQSPPHQMYI